MLLFQSWTESLKGHTGTTRTRSETRIFPSNPRLHITTRLFIYPFLHLTKDKIGR